MATVAQQGVTALDRTRTEQAAELNTRRTQVAELQRHVQQQGSELQLTRDENRRLGERYAIADKRMVQAEDQARAAQQKAMQANNERVAVQAAHDKALEDYAQTARKLTETGKAFAATQAKLKSAEAALAQALSESTELSAALDEANQKHLDESNARHAHIEALQARAGVSEKLLEEARQALTARTEELRALERSAAEASDAHSSAGEKVEQMTAAHLQRERLERAMAEGALESGRKDIARLMHELAALRHRPVAPAALPENALSPETPGTSDGLKTAA
jgi:hypothetical protein